MKKVKLLNNSDKYSINEINVFNIVDKKGKIKVKSDKGYIIKVIKGTNIKLYIGVKILIVKYELTLIGILTKKDTIDVFSKLKK